MDDWGQTGYIRAGDPPNLPGFCCPYETGGGGWPGQSPGFCFPFEITGAPLFA
jgi:hypothetical protein